jgi:hypothetical protein
MEHDLAVILNRPPASGLAPISSVGGSGADRRDSFVADRKDQNQPEEKPGGPRVFGARLLSPLVDPNFLTAAQERGQEKGVISGQNTALETPFESAQNTGQGPRKVPGQKSASELTGTTGKANRPEPGGLTEDEARLVARLKSRDAEVRRHEQAHANNGGQYAGTPSYSYERGPDGRN